MYLSNRDIKWAIDQKTLIVRPTPEDFNLGYDETSIDLHLDSIDKGARVWDLSKFSSHVGFTGVLEPELHLGSFDFRESSNRCLVKVPDEITGDDDQLVFRRGTRIVIKPMGFLLWTTKEWLGTPDENPQFICFVNAKSTKARTGIVVHLSAPTIHAGWQGNVTLEIVNFGPFHFVLKEDDAIAQLTVATISSSPNRDIKTTKSQTSRQSNPAGAPSHGEAKVKKKTKKP